MRVLQIISQMGVGGAERMVVELSRALSTDGDAVAIVAERGAFDYLVSGTRIERYEMPGRGRSPLLLANAGISARRAIQAFRPDLIHAHNVKVTGVAGAARIGALGTRPPVITTFHGVDPREYRQAARILRIADVVACVSQDLIRGLTAKGLDPARLRLIANAVSLPARLSAERRRALDDELGLEDGAVITSVGRLVPQKAHHRLIDAAARLVPRIPGATFLVVGEGPLRADLQADVRSRKLERAIRFTGARDDAREIIARSDLVVLSSDWEGQPLVALEALAASVPVVATDVPGMKELLGGGCGVVVPRDAGALAGAIAELLSDEARRERMGALGRESVASRFSLERMVSSYRRLYREVTAA